MDKFLKLNFNDGGRSKYFNYDASDCATRAIAISENIDYMEAFNMVSRELKGESTPHEGVPNTIVKKILKQLGYVEVRKDNRKMFKPDELPKDKRIIIHTRQHVCVFDNMITHDIIFTGRNEVVHWYFEKME